MRLGAGRPAAGELHRLMARHTAVGAVIPASAIRSNPAWAGGPVAFMHRSFLPSSTRTADSYTVIAHNQRCTACAPPAP